MTTTAMPRHEANEWGQAMAKAACKWAAVLAPGTDAGSTPPYTLLLIFDRKRVLQGWFALWPLPEHSSALRIVKTKGNKQARISTLADGTPMVQLERHVRDAGITRRYWLVWNRKTKRYEDFKTV
jgi:hypothetical protein